MVVCMCYLIWVLVICCVKNPCVYSHKKNSLCVLVVAGLVMYSHNFAFSVITFGLFIWFVLQMDLFVINLSIIWGWDLVWRWWGCCWILYQNNIILKFCGFLKFWRRTWTWVAESDSDSGVAEKIIYEIGNSLEIWHRREIGNSYLGIHVKLLYAATKTLEKVVLLSI